MFLEEIKKANNMLLEVQESKFTRVLGHAGCSEEKEGGVAFPELQPCFSLKYGDGKEDRIETEDYEIMTLEVHNPYTNVSLEDLTIVSLSLRFLHKGKEVEVPTAQYTKEKLADLTPSKMISYGTLAPGQSLTREIVLGTFRTAPGDYTIKLESCYSIRFEQESKDSFVIPVGLS